MLIQVRILWEASRKLNFDLHVLESKAQDAEDQLKTVASQARKVTYDTLICLLQSSVYEYGDHFAIDFLVFDFR